MFWCFVCASCCYYGNVSTTPSHEFELTDVEGAIITIDDCDVAPLEKVGYWLVWKLLRRSTFNSRAFRQIIGQIWRTRHRFEIHEVDQNRFTFRFATEADRDFIIRGAPWIFDRFMVVLKILAIDDCPMQVELDSALLGQGLPSSGGLRTVGVAKAVGNMFGSL